MDPCSVAGLSSLPLVLYEIFMSSDLHKNRVILVMLLVVLHEWFFSKAWMEIVAIKALVNSFNSTPRPQVQYRRFIEHLEDVPLVDLMPLEPMLLAPLLTYWALIGSSRPLAQSQRCRSPCYREINPLIHSQVSLFAIGKGFISFLFHTIEAHDMIFRYSPYFMGSKGMFLSP